MIDQRIFTFINGLAGKSQFLDFLGVFFADYFGYFLLIFVILLIFKFESWKAKIYYFSLIGLAAILSRGIITEFIRFFYYRPRPFEALEFTPLIDHATKAGFPSGNMAFYFAIILPVFLINKRLGWYLAGGGAIMGLARIFVGVHWPLDIVGGIAVAIISFYLIKFLLKDVKSE